MNREPGTVNREQRSRHGGLFSPDTRPEARAILVRLLQEMPPEQKSRQMWALTTVVRGSALAGLRARHPEAAEAEIRWRFVAMAYGSELARRVYGWDLEADQ